MVSSGVDIMPDWLATRTPLMENSTMDRSDQQIIKEESEYECATLFIQWFNRRNNTRYEVMRTEEFFPELEGRKRWDFVAHQKREPDWIAIEVKQITSREYYEHDTCWRKVFEQVKGQLKNRMNGAVEVLAVPNVVVHQDQRAELAKAISQAILDASSNPKRAPFVDVWPEVRKQLLGSLSVLCDRTTTTFGLRETEGPALHVRFVIPSKRFDIQAMYLGGRWVSSSVDKDAIADLFTPEADSGRIRADSQLEVAKQKGARTTVIVVDGNDWHLKDLRRVVKRVSASLMPNVDLVCHADTSHWILTQFWP
jgi:hypothetical protein